MSKRQPLTRTYDEIVRDLPPLEELVRGSLVERHLRCGKAGCHCADAADKGHRVFYLSASFAGGRTEQITVPVSLVPVVRRWIENYQRWWAAVEEISVINRHRLRKRLIEADPAAGGKGKRRGGS